MRQQYKCPCGIEPNYGLSFEMGNEETYYWIGSCCDGGSGMGCVAALDIKYCPFCGLKLPIEQKVNK